MKLIPCILLFAIVATTQAEEVSTLLGRGKIKLKQHTGTV